MWIDVGNTAIVCRSVLLWVRFVCIESQSHTLGNLVDCCETGCRVGLFFYYCQLNRVPESSASGPSNSVYEVQCSFIRLRGRDLKEIISPKHNYTMNAIKYLTFKCIGRDLLSGRYTI